MYDNMKMNQGMATVKYRSKLNFFYVRLSLLLHTVRRSQ